MLRSCLVESRPADVYAGLGVLSIGGGCCSGCCGPLAGLMGPHRIVCATEAVPLQQA